jgi:acyl carrier protein
MELNNFITHFINQFDEEPTITITGDTDFKNDIDEWDSLTAMSVIAMIIDEYDVSLKGEELKNCSTVNDIFELIKSKK